MATRSRSSLALHEDAAKSAERERLVRQQRPAGNASGIHTGLRVRCIWPLSKLASPSCANAGNWSPTTGSFGIAHLRRTAGTEYEEINHPIDQASIIITALPALRSRSRTFTAILISSPRASIHHSCPTY